MLNQIHFGIVNLKLFLERISVPKPFCHGILGEEDYWNFHEIPVVARQLIIIERTRKDMEHVLAEYGTFPYFARYSDIKDQLKTFANWIQILTDPERERDKQSERVHMVFIDWIFKASHIAPSMDDDDTENDEEEIDEESKIEEGETEEGDEGETEEGDEEETEEGEEEESDKRARRVSKFFDQEAEDDDDGVEVVYREPEKRDERMVQMIQVR